MILRTLATMGPQHAYGIASRLEAEFQAYQLNLNQGTIYPALVRQRAALLPDRAALWGKPKQLREAKVLQLITLKAGLLKALDEETARWRQMAGVVEKLLAEEQ